MNYEYDRSKSKNETLLMLLLPLVLCAHFNVKFKCCGKRLDSDVYMLLNTFFKNIFVSHINIHVQTHNNSVLMK